MENAQGEEKECSFREGKHQKKVSESVAVHQTPSLAGDLPSTSAPSVSTFVDGDVQPEVESDSSSSSDSDFDPTEGLKSDPVAMMGEFCIDWIASLSREDVYSLSLLLFQILQQDFLLLLLRLLVSI